MVVEDHTFQRAFAVRMLQALGARQVTEAADGHDALVALGATTAAALPDVIICDLEMPRMDGIEFLSMVAKRQLARAVIITSAREPEILRSVRAMVEASGLAVLAALPKPIQPQALRYAFAGDVPARRGITAPRAAITREQLAHALDTRQFHAVFQPKVVMATREFASVEVLARWVPPDAPSWSPLEFVPALIRESLITPLTHLMLAEALRALTAWERHGLRPRVCLNVSMATLTDLDVVDQFARTMQDADLPPQRLLFEVTETEIITDVARVLNVLSRLRLKGFMLAIDDFGTGHSSLLQLDTIPANVLKIDRTFVRYCARSRREGDIVRSSISLAHQLGLTTVAEGVETPEAWDFLVDAGCDEAQGYSIGKPMHAADLPAWASRWQGMSDHDPQRGARRAAGPGKP